MPCVQPQQAVWRNTIWADRTGDTSHPFPPVTKLRNQLVDLLRTSSWPKRDADQEDQVRTFWQREGSVAVIDRSIFRYFSEAMGHSMSKVDLHPIFAPVTNFKVGFKDAAVRDAFNRGLAELCLSGACHSARLASPYAEMLNHYSVVLDQSPCDQ